MNDDFNPFDLSAPPKPTEKQKEKDEPGAKAVVRRVSLGPLFHSRVLSYLAFALLIVLFILVGYISMNYYLDQKVSKNLTVTSYSHIV